ncbi:MAG: hypothetical protein EG825_03360 [Rhodocyclaceae bacterium]|nr:hypothetical protein [Rhodocyclaceae bacterium]
MLIAILSGVLIGVGGTQVGIVLIAGCLLVASFFISVQLTFWALLVATFVLVGPVQYFGRIGKIFWLPYLLGLLLFARAAISMFFAPKLSRSGGGKLSPVEAPLILFAVILVASTVLNLSPLLQVLLAAKEYFFLWGAWFVVMGGIVTVRSLDRLWGWMPWFLLLQLPAVLYQRFVIATGRQGAASWDAVVGLFGGDPDGGGASGAMAMCSVIAIAFAITHWRRQLVSGWMVLLTGGLGLATIMLAEVKVAIVLIPLAIFLIYGAELAQRPVRSLTMLFVGLLASLAVVYVYQTQFTTTATKAGRSLDAYIVDVIEKNSQVDYVDPITMQMGRVGALTFWWKEQHIEDPLQFIVGSGIGASRMGQVKGEVAQRYGFDIERSSAAILLWDSGVLGLLVLGAAMLAGALAAFRLARQSEAAEEAAILQAIGIGLTIVLLTFPYGPDFIRVPQFQLFAILMLVRVAVAARTRARSKTCAAGASAVSGPRRGLP